MLAARMRHGEGWSDANILNLSSRGLLLIAASPPSRGAYVEVRRGAQIIVGRVVWAEGGRFGVFAQDMLVIDALVANGRQPVNNNDPAVDRRRQPRPGALEWRQVRSRQNGRMLQFCGTVGFAMFLAAAAYETVRETLSRPLSALSTQLAQNR